MCMFSYSVRGSYRQPFQHLAGLGSFWTDRAGTTTGRPAEPRRVLPSQAGTRPRRLRPPGHTAERGSPTMALTARHPGADLRILVPGKFAWYCVPEQVAQRAVSYTHLTLPTKA